MTRLKKSLKRTGTSERAESAALPPPFPTPSAAPAAQPLAPRSAETLTLDDEELHRLGTLTSFDSWLGRVASGHDVGVCILMRSVEQLKEAFNEKYEALCLVDATAARGQRIHFAFHGGLCASVSALLRQRAASGRNAPLLLSAYGAQLAPHVFPGTNEPVVEWREGRVAMRALWDAGEWCDVDEKARAAPGAAAPAKRPRTSTSGKGKERAHDDAAGSSAGSARSSGSGSASKKAKATPAAAQGTPTYIVPRTGKGKAAAIAAAAVPAVPTTRTLGGLQYPPLSMCVRNGQIANVIAVVAWKREARFSAGGTGDPMLSLGLCDPSTPGKHFSVNIFSPSMLELPTPVAGNVLLLRKVYIQRLAGVQYKDRPDWALLTARNDALQRSPRLMHPISGAEEDAMREMAAWGAAHFNVLTSNRSRPQVTLDQLQGSVFCDITAEVVKTFTRNKGDNMPPELYITDYTFHAAFARANDFKLGDISQDELDEQRRQHGEFGGFVCGTSLWDQQVEALDFLSTGDIVTISNFQPRVQPNNILQGRLGGRLTISLIRQDQHKDIKEVQNLLRSKEARRLARAAQETARMEAMLGEHDEEAEAAARELEEAHAQRLAGAQGASESAPPIPSAESPEPSAPEPSPPQPSPPEVKPVIRKPSPSRSASPPSPSPEREVPRPRAAGSVVRAAPVAPAAPVARAAPRQVAQAVPRPASDEEVAVEAPCASRDARTKCEVPESCSLTLAALAARTVQEDTTWRVRVRVVDCLPRDIDEWACAVCAQCDATLPREHNFCVRCGDDDGQSVRFTFNFGLLVEEASGAPGVKRARVPIVVSGEQAAKFLCGMDPQQVRERPDKLHRLRRRLLPILGSTLAEAASAASVKREPGAETQTTPARPMTIGVRVSRSGARVKYRLVGTALEKE